MMIFLKIGRGISLYRFRRKWRKLNSHNQTVAKNIFPPKSVKVGKETYGALEVHTWGENEQGLEIGSYVSIANGVKFILGGNHRMNTFSTFPFKAKFSGKKVDSLSKGKIAIDDDVWLGLEALVLSGTHIGKGAVIGARTVVSGQIPSYSIVVGNPGKIIKYRFNRDIIDLLEQINFADLSENFIRDNIDLMYKPLTRDTLQLILKNLKKEYINK